MTLLFFPIVVAIFFCTTMQRYGQNQQFCSEDYSVVATLDKVSYWGGDYQYKLRIYDRTLDQKITVAGDAKRYFRFQNGATVLRWTSSSGAEMLGWNQLLASPYTRRFSPTDYIRIPGDGQVLLRRQENGAIVVEEAGRKQRTILHGHTWWWWPARWTAWGAGLIWWLTFSIGQRRKQRSMQPAIDVALLHVVVVVCAGCRLWAYHHGPHWSGYLHDWESVAFIGASLSMLTWFLLWVAIGPQAWAVRFGFFIFGVATVIGIVIGILASAAHARGGNWAYALAETLVGSMSQVPVILGLFIAARLCGLRLQHKNDSAINRLAQAPGPDRRMSIRDMCFWMVAFGVLFTVIKLCVIEVPSADVLTKIFFSGVLTGCSGFATLWLGLGRTLWRIACVVATSIAVCAYHYWLDRVEILHVGYAWVPMTLLAAFAFRWHGYSWSRQEYVYADEADVPTKLEDGEFVW